MEIQPGATAALHGLTLTGGLASGPFPANSGGAITNNNATLSLIACTLFDNSADILGGGIFSDGSSRGRAWLSLNACTLSGNSAGSGGGIVSRGNSNGSATLSLVACILSDNSATSDGGGIFSEGRFTGSASLSLSDCILSGNSATREGGGIFSDGSSNSNDNGSATLSLSACTLTDNSARFGGGILSDGNDGSATLSLSACTLSGNSATSDGGGILSRGNSNSSSGSSSSAMLSLSACTLSGNSAGGDGGAIFSIGSDGPDSPDGPNSSATLSLSASTLTGNSASSNGGGIFNDGNNGSATLSLMACTLTGNSARFNGGGIFSNGSGGSATLSLNNSILAGNRLDSSVGTGSDLREFGDGATTTATGNNLMSGLVGQDSLNDTDVIITDDLKLALLGDYGGPTQTMIPLPGSQAIDAATSSTRSTDQRGFPITDDAPDIGAVEFQGADDLAPLLDIDQDGDGTTFGIELALGTDPFVSDPGNPRNPTLSINSTTGATTLNFGISPAAAGVVALVLERSTDLETWSRAFQSNPGSFSNAASFALSGNDAGPRTFYRFTAEPR